MKIRQNSSFEITPAGMHLARCYMVCDLGIQETEWQGNIKHLHKVKISFELSNELMSGENGGKPFSVSQKYTVSMGDKAKLREHLESWRGTRFTQQELDDFDLSFILGESCYLNVVHNESGGRTYANIASINPVPKGVECPPIKNNICHFSLDNYTEEDVQRLPEWLRDSINFEVPNYKVLNDKQRQNEASAFGQIPNQAPSSDSDYPELQEEPDEYPASWWDINYSSS